MRPLQQLFEAAHELTQFCLPRQGKCFPGWNKEKIFAYLCHSILEKQIFIVKVENKVTGIAIAKPTGQGRLIVYEVIGNRAACKSIFKQVMNRWPDLKRFFAFRVCGREHDIEELNINTVRRFTT